MRLFSPDGKLYRGMVKLTEAVGINLLWILFSLPVVTFGASTAAAFSVLMKLVKDEEGHVAQDFLAAFRANLKQGIAMSFINLVCIAAVYLDIRIMDAAEENSFVFLIIAVVAGYVFIFSLLYAYPLIVRYENTVLNTLRKSFRISMRYFLRSLGAVILAAMEIFLFVFNYTTLFIGLFFGGSVVMGTISLLANAVFEDIEKNTPEAVKR